MSHAKLSPSSAGRWMACPGSVALIDSLNVPDTSSPAAEEGTHAHSALEHALDKRVSPFDLVDGWFYDRDLTEETAVAINVAYEYVMQYVEKGATFVAERKVTTAETLGRADVYGTADITIMHPGGVPEVVDYKHGRGVLVEVNDNRQLQIYLLGVMEADSIDRQVGGFTTIIQPRCPHADGPIRTTGYSPAQLDEIVDEIVAAAAATEASDAPCVPGESQCRWCPAKGACPAIAQHNMAAVADLFGAPADAPTDVLIAAAEDTLRLADAKLTNPEQIAELLRIEPMISGWLKAVREHAINMLNGGQQVPGYKMVAGRKTRDWDEKDEAAMLKWLAGRKRKDGKKVALDGASVRKLLSPAQAEKAIKPVVSEATWNNVKARITSSSGKPVLAPETDSRPGVNSTVEDIFDREVVDLF